MNKKRFLGIICTILILIAGGSIVIYNNYVVNIDSSKYLASKDEPRSIEDTRHQNNSNNGMSLDFKKFDGKWSIMKFTSKKGDKINIKDNTKINKGKFYIVVLDSEYNIIAKKNEVKDSGDIHFVIPKDGKYSIRIAGEKASGNLNIRTNKNIDISYVDFFD
jgi:hypothetical protein